MCKGRKYLCMIRGSAWVFRKIVRIIHLPSKTLDISSDMMSALYWRSSCLPCYPCSNATSESHDATFAAEVCMKCRQTTEKGAGGRTGERASHLIFLPLSPPRTIFVQSERARARARFPTPPTGGLADDRATDATAALRPSVRRPSASIRCRSPQLSVSPASRLIGTVAHIVVPSPSLPTYNFGRACTGKRTFPQDC